MSAMVTPTQQHRFVLFDAMHMGPQMRRNITAAKRILREDAKKRGYRLKPVPLPPEAGIFPIARMEGQYRVIVQWDQMPPYGPPRYMGRVDVLAEPLAPAKSPLMRS